MKTLLAAFLGISVIVGIGVTRLRDHLNRRERMVPVAFDIQTGMNIRWSAQSGSTSFSSPVFHRGKVFIGTNNTTGYLPRYPSIVDLGVLLCFDASDGSLLWQASSEKLSTGRVHDWPLQGIVSTPAVQDDRLWYLTNRCELACLDTQGFYDQEDDGVPLSADVALSIKEADVVWKLDLMKELDVNPHNASASSPVVADGRVFVVTGNGLSSDHVTNASVDAPSFIAVDAATGALIWSDDSPSPNILHGQWGSPTYGVFQGVPQVIFPGGDGWLYSFDPAGNPDGTGKLLWKFDCNPKDSVWLLGGRGTRNNLLARPTVHDGLVYVTVGQDPEHGDGVGHVWCIDPNKSGDVSTELVFHSASPQQPIAHKRVQACDAKAGDFTQPNRNSAMVWHYTGMDLDGDGEIADSESMHRTLSQVAIEGELAFFTDTYGLIHCVDRRTGRGHWQYDLLASTWSTPVISADHVIVTDEDGAVSAFALSADPTIAMPGGNPLSISHLDSSGYATPTINNGVLYILSSKKLYAISD
ncbi:outer membrane protein assembly factor BamB family protein [Stieleria varia]|uniref:Outer membrane biogenesis protein BamB n=1 Tax=Stieleria varia TaxID=2528005 RepID=A0A5C6B231_9BACT|nr:PQQ-binding-like beta-propeller repeat protein [Stieleria varia]TWU04454.1 outer membrane biogenesis protein BamB [Stieleria varia]